MLFHGKLGLDFEKEDTFKEFHKLLNSLIK